MSKLSTDATLGKIKELFLTNVYTYSKPAPEGKNGFTSMPAEVEKIAVPEFAH